MTFRHTTIALTIASTISLLSGCEARDADGPRPGAWRLTGEDSNGASWTATCTLERASGGFSGTFAWKKNGVDAGTESFTGTYDATGRVVTLAGQHATGNVVTANYIATLSADREHLTNGRWTSSSGPAGKWTADRVAN